MKKQFAFILLLTIRFLMLAASKAETGMGYWNGQRCFWSPVDGLEDCEPIILFDSEISAMNPQNIFES